MEVELKSSSRWKWTKATYILIPGIPTVGTFFCEFVETLPEWERELLVHTKLASDAYVMGVALEHGLRAVSDGSKWFPTQAGSFGWILSSDVGERLANGMDPARSSRPNSFRSEGYGMLTHLVFLQRLAKFIQLQQEKWQGIIATDSKSLIDTIQGPHRPQFNSAQATVFKRPLDPKLLQEMPGLKLQHIKGHQDRDRDYYCLPLLAQLNVDADQLANQYQRDHGRFQSKVLLTRWAGAHLLLPTANTFRNGTNG